MRMHATICIRGALCAAVALSLAPTNEAAGQDFKIPLSLSHWVYEPGNEIKEPQQRSWTVGLGTNYGLQNDNAYGFAAQATYGGPYWHWAGGAGLWNGGVEGADHELGLGFNFHYNVFQSRDRRTRVGPQFAWSTASVGDGRTHAVTYRARVSHARSTSLSLYGGIGAEVARFSISGASIVSTHATLLAGVHVRLDKRFALSTAIETVFSDPSQLTLSSSLQLDLGRRANLPRRKSGPGPA